jgi:hypothetical protein
MRYRTVTPYRQGAKDYAEGRPFCSAYEEWSPEEQQSYERGRMMQAKKKWSADFANLVHELRRQ